MFRTGSRSIFDVSKDHIGHSIDLLPIEEEGVTKGIKFYCRTCNEVLLQQITESWDITSEISRRKSVRVGALNYDQWFNTVFVPRQTRWHDEECDCGDPLDCETNIDYHYEGSELEEFYEDYLRTFTPAPTRQSNGWDTQGWNT